MPKNCMYRKEKTTRHDASLTSSSSSGSVVGSRRLISGFSRVRRRTWRRKTAVYECRKCSFSVRQLGSLLEHYRTTEHGRLVQRRSLRCDKCYYTSRRHPAHLVNHVRLMHLVSTLDSISTIFEPLPSPRVGPAMTSDTLLQQFPGPPSPDHDVAPSVDVAMKLAQPDDVIDGEPDVEDGSATAEIQHRPPAWITDKSLRHNAEIGADFSTQQRQDSVLHVLCSDDINTGNFFDITSVDCAVPCLDQTCQDQPCLDQCAESVVPSHDNELPKIIDDSCESGRQSFTEIDVSKPGTRRVPAQRCDAAGNHSEHSRQRAALAELGNGSTMSALLHASHTTHDGGINVATDDVKWIVADQPSTALDHRSTTATRCACHLCPLSYKRIADLNRHIRQKHGAHSRDAVDHRAFLLTHYFNWMKTAPTMPASMSMEPLDLRTRLSSETHDPLNATAWTTARQQEPLDLSTRGKKSLPTTTSRLENPHHLPFWPTSTGPLPAGRLQSPLLSFCSSVASRDLPDFPTWTPAVDAAISSPSKSAWWSRTDSVWRWMELMPKLSKSTKLIGEDACDDGGNRDYKMDDKDDSNGEGCNDTIFPPRTDNAHYVTASLRVSSGGYQGNGVEMASGRCRENDRQESIAMCPLCPFVCHSTGKMMTHLNSAHDDVTLSENVSPTRVGDHKADSQSQARIEKTMKNLDNKNTSTGFPATSSSTLNRDSLVELCDLPVIGLPEESVEMVQQVDAGIKCNSIGVSPATRISQFSDVSPSASSGKIPVTWLTANPSNNYWKDEANHKHGNSNWTGGNLASSSDDKVDKSALNVMEEERVDHTEFNTVDIIDDSIQGQVHHNHSEDAGESFEIWRETSGFAAGSSRGRSKKEVPDCQLSGSWTVSSRRLKRFSCSACPYRSNFRSDVVRHIRHKHPASKSAHIAVLNSEVAAATLTDYLNTWAKKKFVLAPRYKSLPNDSRASSPKDDVVDRHSACYSFSSTTPGSSFSTAPLRNKFSNIANDAEQRNVSPSTEPIEYSASAMRCKEQTVTSTATNVDPIMSMHDDASTSSMMTPVSADARQHLERQNIHRHLRHFVAETGECNSRYQCPLCHYVGRNRNDYLHHSCFNRHRVAATDGLNGGEHWLLKECLPKPLVGDGDEVHCLTSKTFPTLTESLVGSAQQSLLAPNTRSDAVSRHCAPPKAPSMSYAVSAGVDVDDGGSVMDERAWQSSLTKCSIEERGGTLTGPEFGAPSLLKNFSPSYFDQSVAHNFTAMTAKSTEAGAGGHLDESWMASSYTGSTTATATDSERIVGSSKRRKTWRCELCPYATYKRSQLSCHLSLHGSQQRYRCLHCCYSVSGLHLLMQHNRLHVEPKLVPLDADDNEQVTSLKVIVAGTSSIVAADGVVKAAEAAD